MADVESKVLCAELGRLGGFGARWAAKFLPNVAHEDQLTLDMPLDKVTSVVSKYFAATGKSTPEFASNGMSFSMITGSGHLNLNPTIVQARIEQTVAGLLLIIRAVAKEGVIKQSSAQQAVDKAKGAILAELA